MFFALVFFGQNHGKARISRTATDDSPTHAPLHPVHLTLSTARVDAVFEVLNLTHASAGVTRLGLVRATKPPKSSKWDMQAKLRVGVLSGYQLFRTHCAVFWYDM